MDWLFFIKCYGNDRGVPSACLLSKSFQFHSLQVNGISRVIYRRALHVLRHLHVFIKIRRIHETRCLWSVFKFLRFEGFNLPDVLRQFRLKLALLNETLMCWNVVIVKTVLTTTRTERPSVLNDHFETLPTTFTIIYHWIKRPPPFSDQRPLFWPKFSILMTVNSEIRSDWSWKFCHNLTKLELVFIKYYAPNSLSLTTVNSHYFLFVKRFPNFSKGYNSGKIRRLF